MTAEEFKAALEEMTRAATAYLPPDTLRALEASLARLEASGLSARALKVGDRAPDFVLPDAFGAAVDSAALRACGPLVISFYRGAWCPYCSLELSALQGHLDAFAARGAMLVAVSPQTPDNSLSTQEKLALGFPVLSDVGNKVARAFGLVFTLEEPLRPLYAAMGADLPALNGDNSFELPMPATYVIGQDGVIRLAFVSADYRARPAPQDIRAALG